MDNIKQILKLSNVGMKYVTAMNKHYRYIFSTGGTRSSKTYSALQLFHIKATKSKKPLVFIVAGLTVPITKKNLIKTYKDIAGPEFWDDNTYNKSDKILTYPNGSIVYFMSHGEHNAEDKYTGIEADYALLDELNLSPEAAGVLKQLGMRLLSGTIIVTQNPTRRKEWINDLQSNPRCYSIHSTYKDNIDNLPIDLVEEIEYQGSKDKRYKSVYLEGKYMANAEASVFPDINIVNVWPSKYKWESYGQDYGFKKDPSTLSLTRFYNNEIWIRGLGYEEGLTTKQLYEMNKVAGRSLIIGDSSEPRLITELNNLGNNVVGIKKFPGHKLVAARAMNNYKINVYYDDPNIVREFEDYEFKKVNGKYQDVLSDGNDHYIDSVFYAVRDKLSINGGKYNYR